MRWLLKGVVGGCFQPKEKTATLEEEYCVGQALGIGTFGVVSSCTHRATGVEYAVKVVDKAGTPIGRIKKEASMLQSLDHPNIVAFHDVYYERSFVCIVMEKYNGGDLVVGLETHLKERGQMNCFHVVHVLQQICASVEYLHQRGVIHRDVKSDNFLVDRRDITDPACKVVLADFGTACNVKSGERLRKAVGTRTFWSPEIFDNNYGVKVDVWAVGVIMYGLVMGRYPFRDEAEIRAKQVRIAKHVHPNCEELMRNMLDKTEAQRFDSTQVMSHPWLSCWLGDSGGLKLQERTHQPRTSSSTTQTWASKREARKAPKSKASVVPAVASFHADGDDLFLER